MVKIVPKNNKKLYQCEECSFHYQDKETAEKCEAWCKEHKNHKEIGGKSMEMLVF